MFSMNFNVKKNVRKLPVELNNRPKTTATISMMFEKPTKCGSCGGAK
jgi:hypothetical protein